jgi:hypothetical protein
MADSPRTPSALARRLADFADATWVAGWFSIDDRVMGGVSTSRLRHDAAGHAVFEGTLSLERNGGFASVRSPPAAFAAPDVRRYWMEVAGDGRRYKLALRTDEAFDGVGYQIGFEPPAGTWVWVDLPVAGIAPSFRGRPAPSAPPFDPGRVRQIGLLAADGRAGRFALSIRSIWSE